MTLYSVKEYWQLTPEQIKRERSITPKGTGIGTGGSTVHVPHATRAAAYVEMMWRRLVAPPIMRFKIVDHDEEMREWHRWDFIKNPTPDDARRASEMTGVIPSIRPGESVAIALVPSTSSLETPK